MTGPGKKPMNSSFEKLKAIVQEENFPSFITRNIEVLYYLLYINSQRKNAWDNIQNFVQSRLLLEYLRGKGIIHERIAYTPYSQQFEPAQVLFFLTPYRQDYEGLKYPSAKKLLDLGVSTAILAGGEDKMDPITDVRTYNYLDFFYSLQAYREAKKLFHREYLGPIQRLSCKAGLSSYQVCKLKIFYQSYALDKAAALKALQLLKPRVVLGIHYIRRPGCLDALLSLKQRPAIILIQHGFFSPDTMEFHDFKGADSVILWGNYFQQALNKMPEPPPSLVIGNPKLEQCLEEVRRMEESGKLEKENGKTRLLFISSGSPGMNKIYRDSLKIFTQAVKDLSHVEIRYKLHPTESEKTGYLYYESGGGNSGKSILKGGVMELIYKADIIVGSISSSLYEAMAVGKPVVQVLPPDIDSDWNLRGLACASDVESLKALINKLRVDNNFLSLILKAQREFTEDLFEELPGSAERIALYLKSLI